MNIVLAKTPYHVLLAHAALRAGDVLRGNSVLIYLGVESDDVKSLIDRPSWDAVYFFSFPSKRVSWKSARAVRQFLAEHGLDVANVLLTCNDVNWRSQLFISQISFSLYCLAEDGLGAYSDYRRTPLGWIYAEIYLRLFYRRVTFHYGKMNQSKADVCLSLSNSAFPWRHGVPKKLITSAFSKYCKEVSKRSGYGRSELSSISALLVTQPLSDQGYWSYSDELSAYSKMLRSQSLRQGAQVLIKKHPAESSSSFLNKVFSLRREFGGVTFHAVESEVPIEVICQALPPGAQVFSIVSTGALNASLLRADLEVFCHSSWAQRLGDRWPVSFL